MSAVAIRHVAGLSSAMVEVLADVDLDCHVAAEVVVTGDCHERSFVADDRESAVERRMRDHLQRCHCACCRLLLGLHQEAEQWDRAERQHTETAHRHTGQARAYNRQRCARTEARRAALVAGQGGTR